MRNKVFHYIFLLCLAAFSVTIKAGETIEKDNKHTTIIAGWLETIILEPWQIRLRAKLDTGAKTSSLHAVDIERFEKDGVPWVRFQTHAKTDNSAIKRIELPIKRDVKIKSHHNGATIRPVVELQFCLNGQHYKGEFSLADRDQFNYPVLLGRRVLKQGIMVDASATFLLSTSEKRCKNIANTTDN